MSDWPASISAEHTEVEKSPHVGSSVSDYLAHIAKYAHGQRSSQISRLRLLRLFKKSGELPDKTVQYTANTIVGLPTGLSISNHPHLSWSQGQGYLDEFSVLPANWDGEDADQISQSSINQVTSILRRLWSLFAARIGDKFMPSNIVPRRNGGLQLEWHGSYTYLEVTIEPSGEMKTMVRLTTPEGRSRFRTNDANMLVVIRQITEFLGLTPAWLTSF